MELYLIHLVFISACVYFSYMSGYKTGRGQMLEDLLDKQLFTLRQLKEKFLD